MTDALPISKTLDPPLAVYIGELQLNANKHCFVVSNIQIKPMIAIVWSMLFAKESQ